MTTEEKIDNFRNLLIGYYSKEKKEVFEIGSKTLEACGFDCENQGGEFWEMICPRLKREGILRNYSPLVFKQSPQPDFNKNRLKDKAGEHLDYLRISMLREKTTAEETEEDKECLKQVNNFYHFEVNGKKLKEIEKDIDKKIDSEKSDKLQSKKQFIHRQDNLLYIKELKPEILTGNLGAYSDGTIRYKKEIIKMRNQLKDLCRLFMNHPDRLLTIDDIRDTIIKADKRILTPFTTIAKYVSELHNSLKIHFKKDVIFNQKEEGWYFKP